MHCHGIYRDGPVYPIPARVISSLRATCRNALILARCNRGARHDANERCSDGGSYRPFDACVILVSCCVNSDDEGASAIGRQARREPEA